MAIDKRLQVFDSEGNPVDYDILASDVKFLPDGKDLPTKLGELEEEIGEGGYTPPQGGIPATDLAPAVQTTLDKADTAYQKPASGIPASDIASGVIPDVSNLATKTEVYDKTTADGRYVQKETGKGLSTNDYTTADKTKLAGISAGAEVNVIDGIIVGNTEVQPVNKKVTIPAGQDGVTPHIGQNGNWWLGDENDSENDTGVTAQGPAGTSITDADLTIGNALNGQGDVLGMAGAMQMKANIDSLFTSLSRLYSKLGNMAFWNAADKAAAAPTALDWQVPKKTLTIANNITNGIVMYNGNPVIAPMQVDMGSTVELLVVGDEGYAIASCSASGATVVNNGDGTFTVSVKVDDTMTLTITGTAAAVKSITLVAKDFAGRTLTDALSISVNQVASGEDLDATIELLDTYFDAVAIASVKDASNNDVTYTYSNGVISIEDVTSDITITATVTKTLKIYTGKTINRHSAVVVDSGGCFTDYIRLDGLSNASVLRWYYGFNAAAEGQGSNKRCMNFYNKDKKLLYFSEQWDAKLNPVGATPNSNTYRDITTTIISNALNNAGLNVPLYARISIKMDGDNLVSGAALSQGNTAFFDATDVESATAPTTHSVTYNNNGSATCNCEDYRPNVIDGENFETLITGTINTLTVTMDGVDITQQSWITNGKIVINSVTGALVITIT